MALADGARALVAAGNTGEVERVAVEAELVAGTITDERQRAWVLVEVACALAAAGNTGEAERISCQVLLTTAGQSP